MGAGRSSAIYEAMWAVVRRIPRGRVATYGQVAALAGHPRQPRLAGYALHAAPEGLPWHRVINARGEVSRRATSLEGAAESLQRALLEAEGIRFDSWGRIDLEAYRWRPRGTGASVRPPRPRRPFRRTAR